MKIKLRKEQNSKKSKKKITKIKVKKRVPVSAKPFIERKWPAVAEVTSKKKNSVLEMSTKPIKKDWRPQFPSVNYRWFTTCGRYYINATIMDLGKSSYSHYSVLVAIQAEGSHWRIIATEIRTLEKALDVLLKYHTERFNLKGTTVNEHEFLGSAKSVIEEIEKFGPYGTSVRAATAKPDEETPAGPIKVSIKLTPKDEWGYREGSRAAKINTVFMTNNKPLTVREIEKLSQASSVHGHLTKLVQTGKAKKLKDGRYQSLAAKEQKPTAKIKINLKRKG